MKLMIRPRISNWAGLSIAVLFSALGISSCASTSPAAGPTTTVLLPTSAPVAARTLTRDQLLLQTALSGTPIPEWQGIPVMAGIIKSSVTGSGYTYLIKQPLSAIEDFYQGQLIAAGWKLSQRETAETSAFGGPSVALDFDKDTLHANIIALVSTRDQATVVVINVFK